MRPRFLRNSHKSPLPRGILMLLRRLDCLATPYHVGGICWLASAGSSSFLLLPPLPPLLFYRQFPAPASRYVSQISRQTANPRLYDASDDANEYMATAAA